LSILKTFEIVIDGFKYWFYFYFHHLNYIINNWLAKCNKLKKMKLSIRLIL
jgi:hypothetical protein